MWEREARLSPNRAKMPGVKPNRTNFGSAWAVQRKLSEILKCGRESPLVSSRPLCWICSRLAPTPLQHKLASRRRGVVGCGDPAEHGTATERHAFALDKLFDAVGADRRRRHVVHALLDHPSQLEGEPRGARQPQLIIDGATERRPERSLLLLACARERAPLSRTGQARLNIGPARIDQQVVAREPSEAAVIAAIAATWPSVSPSASGGCASERCFRAASRAASHAASRASRDTCVAASVASAIAAALVASAFSRIAPVAISSWVLRAKLAKEGKRHDAASARAVLREGRTVGSRRLGACGARVAHGARGAWCVIAVEDGCQQLNEAHAGKALLPRALPRPQVRCFAFGLWVGDSRRIVGRQSAQRVVHAGRAKVGQRCRGSSPARG
eukprot:3000237-Prymnesium_polylepis.3